MSTGGASPTQATSSDIAQRHDTYNIAHVDHAASSSGIQQPPRGTRKHIERYDGTDDTLQQIQLRPTGDCCELDDEDDDDDMSWDYHYSATEPWSDVIAEAGSSVVDPTSCSLDEPQAPLSTAGRVTESELSYTSCQSGMICDQESHFLPSVFLPQTIRAISNKLKLLLGSFMNLRWAFTGSTLQTARSAATNRRDAMYAASKVPLPSVSRQTDVGSVTVVSSCTALPNIKRIHRSAMCQRWVSQQAAISEKLFERNPSVCDEDIALTHEGVSITGIQIAQSASNDQVTSKIISDSDDTEADEDDILDIEFPIFMPNPSERSLTPVNSQSSTDAALSDALDNKTLSDTAYSPQNNVHLYTFVFLDGEDNVDNLHTSQKDAEHINSKEEQINEIDKPAETLPDDKEITERRVAVDINVDELLEVQNDDEAIPVKESSTITTKSNEAAHDEGQKIAANGDATTLDVAKSQEVCKEEEEGIQTIGDITMNLNQLPEFHNDESLILNNVNAKPKEAVQESQEDKTDGIDSAIIDVNELPDERQVELLAISEKDRMQVIAKETLREDEEIAKKKICELSKVRNDEEVIPNKEPISIFTESTLAVQRIDSIVFDVNELLEDNISESVISDTIIEITKPQETVRREEVVKEIGDVIANAPVHLTSPNDEVVTSDKDSIKIIAMAIHDGEYTTEEIYDTSIGFLEDEAISQKVSINGIAKSRETACEEQGNAKDDITGKVNELLEDHISELDISQQGIIKETEGFVCKGNEHVGEIDSVPEFRTSQLLRKKSK